VGEGDVITMATPGGGAPGGRRPPGERRQVRGTKAVASVRWRRSRSAARRS